MGGTIGLWRKPVPTADTFIARQDVNMKRLTVKGNLMVKTTAQKGTANKGLISVARFEVSTQQTASALRFAHISSRGQGRAPVDAAEVTGGQYARKILARKSIAVRGAQGWKRVEELVKGSHIMEKLTHAHVCSVLFTYDLSLQNRIVSFGILMDVVAGMNLAEYFEEKERQLKDAASGTRLPILNQCRNEILVWSGCLIRALSFVHSHRIRHRDIKPANILIHGWNILISDFRISQCFEIDVNTTTITDPGRQGTPQYWAPEVAAEWPN